jgi:hypothetical protein
VIVCRITLSDLAASFSDTSTPFNMLDSWCFR